MKIIFSKLRPPRCVLWHYKKISKWALHKNIKTQTLPKKLFYSKLTRPKFPETRLCRIYDFWFFFNFLNSNKKFEILKKYLIFPNFQKISNFCLNFEKLIDSVSELDVIQLHYYSLNIIWIKSSLKSKNYSMSIIFYGLNKFLLRFERNVFFKFR